MGDLGTYFGNGSNGYDNTGGYYDDDNEGKEELTEADVWGIVRDKSKGKKPSKVKVKDNYDPFFEEFSLKRETSGSRMIPKSFGSGSEAANGYQFKPQQHSAPINVPNRSNTYGAYGKRSCKGSSSWYDHDKAADDFPTCDNGNGPEGDHDQDDEEGEEDEEDWLPPHEWLTRKMVKTSILSTSILSTSLCENEGGSLKGRDLCRLRNAVLTKTGFIGGWCT